VLGSSGGMDVFCLICNNSFYSGANKGAESPWSLADWDSRILFLMCWVGGSLIRVCGYNIKYGEVEEEFTRVSERLKGGGILEKLLSTSIRVVSQRFGPIGGTLGEIIADTIDGPEESKEELQQKFAMLSQIIEKQRALRNWSIVMMFVFTAVVWTFKYLKVF